MGKIFLIALFVVSVVACKKGNTNANDNRNDTVAVNTIVATIGDSTYTFNKKAFDTLYVQDPANNGLDELELKAFLDTSVNATGFSILIFSSDVDTAKTYSEYNYYTEGFGNMYYTLNNKYTFDADGESQLNPVTVTVTSILSTSIKGTFKGDIHLNGYIDSAKVVVTNGKFNFRK